MATYQCPRGHSSSTPDYCSECGSFIGPSIVSIATSVTSALSSGAEVCPDCLTPRTPGSRFCEVCRYDFIAGTPGVPVPTVLGKPIVQIPPAPVAPVGANFPTVATPPLVPSAPVTSGVVMPAQTSAARVPTDDNPAVTTPHPGLNAVVITDPSLVENEEERRQCPLNAPELIFPLDLEENLVGRRSENKKIYPEVDISDPGVSHRHLMLIQQADGSFTVLELGSANGTILNGVVLTPGTTTPIAVGDEMLIGLWTRLQIRSR